jgi:hypothetical protein
LVAAEVDVAVGVELLDDLRTPTLVALAGGADEVVVGDVQFLPHLLEDRHVAVRQLRRLDARGLGGLDHLDAVLVGAGEEVRVVAGQAVVARDRVGGERGVNVPRCGSPLG